MQSYRELWTHIASPCEFITEEGEGDWCGGSWGVDVEGSGGGPDALVVITRRDPGNVIGEGSASGRSGHLALKGDEVGVNMVHDIHRECLYQGALSAEERMKHEGVGPNLLLERAGMPNGLEVDAGGPGNLICRGVSPVEGRHIRVCSCHAIPDVRLALEGGPNRHAPCRTGGIFPRVGESIPCYEVVKRDTYMKEVGMTHEVPTAYLHSRHKILD